MEGRRRGMRSTKEKGEGMVGMRGASLVEVEGKVMRRAGVG